MSELRRRHLMTLRAASRGEIYLATDFQYRQQGAARARHVTEAVYMLEDYRMVVLGPGGSIQVTTKGETWILRRSKDFAVMLNITA